MIIKVNPHKIELEKEEPVNEREIDISRCHFEFSDEITDDYVKEAYFTLNGKSYKVLIQDNECQFPSEALKEKGDVEIGVVAFKVENEEEIKRYNPSPTYFNTWIGSLKDAENTEPITPTDKEQIEQMLANINIEANKVGRITTITYTNKDGIPRQVTLEDGVSLENMEIINRDLYVIYGGNTSDLGQIEPNIQIGTTTTGTPSTPASVVNVGTSLNPIFNFTIPKGEAGSIKFEIVEQLPTTEIKEDTIYLVPYEKVTVQELPTQDIQLHTIYIVESTGKRYVYNGNQWIEISSDNQYIEYIYINNQWEELGSIGVDINLDDYYTKTETNSLLSGKQDKIDNDHKLSASLVSGLSSVATSGSYNDLSGKPDLSVYLNKSSVVNASSTTAGETYDVRYINSLIGDINTALDTINGEVI